MRLWIVLGGLLPILCLAEVYRWQDENGNWQFGDQPPPKAHDKVNVKPPPKIGQGDAVKRINKRMRRLRESEAAERKKQAKARRQKRAQRRRACNQARERLEKLNGRFQYQDASGNLRSAPLDEVEKDKKRTRQWINQNCD